MLNLYENILEAARDIGGRYRLKVLVSPNNYSLLSAYGFILHEEHTTATWLKAPKDCPHKIKVQIHYDRNGLDRLDSGWLVKPYVGMI